MFAQLKISTRLVGTLGLLLALLVAVTGTALWQLGAMRAVTQEITGNWLIAVERVNKMNTASSDLRIAEYEHVLNADDKALGGLEQSMATLLAAFDADHKAYAATISNHEERKLHESFLAEW